MSTRKIYHDHRSLTRTEVATELRRLADQLESGPDLRYGESGGLGHIIVPEQVQRDIGIGWSGRDQGFTVGVEITWAEPSPASLTVVGGRRDHAIPDSDLG